jgi:hypothetical protein
MRVDRQRLPQVFHRQESVPSDADGCMLDRCLLTRVSRSILDYLASFARLLFSRCGRRRLSNRCFTLDPSCEHRFSYQSLNIFEASTNNKYKFVQSSAVFYEEAIV